MQTIKARLTGISPLLMHNGQLADPTNKWTKALKSITSRKKKSDEDLAELKKVEFFGGLYTDESESRVVIPADMILAVVVGGAKKHKAGSDAKVAVFETEPWFALEYDGPKNPAALWEDGRFCDYRGVVNPGQRTRIMRARPIFRRWSVDIALYLDTEIMNSEALVRALEQAGERVGLGDYRPRFGRFSVETLP